MELIQVVITALVSSIGGALSAILIARYSKRKEERDSGLASDYLKIADMSGVQLEKKINQVDRLEKEIEIIKEARRLRDIETQHERDELKARIQSDLMETQELRNEAQRLRGVVAQQARQLLRVEDVAIRAGEFIDKIKIAVQDIPGVKLDLNGELMDSIVRLKAEKAKRGKE
jgi:hypothetical protein